MGVRIRSFSKDSATEVRKHDAFTGYSRMRKEGARESGRNGACDAASGGGKAYRCAGESLGKVYEAVFCRYCLPYSITRCSFSIYHLILEILITMTVSVRPSSHPPRR